MLAISHEIEFEPLRSQLFCVFHSPCENSIPNAHVNFLLMKAAVYVWGICGQAGGKDAIQCSQLGALPVSHRL
jgi:hypothetical protein